MQAGLNRAEVLTFLLALFLLHYIFYKNNSDLTLVSVSLFYLYMSAIKYKICKSRIIYNKSYKILGDILLLYSRTYAWRKVKCVPLIEGNRRYLFFSKKRKGAEEARYQKYLNFQAKGLLTNKDSGIVKRGHSSFISPLFMPGKK